MQGWRWIVRGTAAALACAATMGCQQLPGTRTQQASALGGAAGAAVGYAMNDENRVLGALIGGALGAGGGYLIGARTDWLENPGAQDAARDAIDDSRRSPVSVGDVARSTTADINNNGFVTLDEMVAMERAGLSDDEVLGRLRATGQVFDLTREQERALLDAGISSRVVREMRDINGEEREMILSRPS
jgi:hypothetical protein